MEGDAREYVELAFGVLGGLGGMDSGEVDDVFPNGYGGWLRSAPGGLEKRRGGGVGRGGMLKEEESVVLWC